MARLVKTNASNKQTNRKTEKTMRESSAQEAFEYIALLVFIVLVLLAVFRHECFEDEAQSWLIARDLGPVGIIRQMKYEGHPFLWYYLLMPLAKTGLPVVSQGLLSAAFGIASAYLILKKSPFPFWLKLLVTYSGGMIYYFSVIARPYCMIPFFLALLAYYDESKQKRPYLYALLIAGLANTHMILLPTAFLLAVYFWGEELVFYRKKHTTEEKKRLALSACIAFAGIAVMTAISVWGLFFCKIIDNYDNRAALTKPGEFAGVVLKTCKVSVSHFYGNPKVPLFFTVLIGFAMLLCLAGCFFDIRQGLVFWAQLIFTVLVQALTWFVLTPRVYLILYTLMFWIWISWQKDRNGKASVWIGKLLLTALIVLCVLSAPAMYRLYGQDVTDNFSTGKMTAQYIKENIPEGSVFVCAGAEMQQSVIVYLDGADYRFYMPSQKKDITYITWDKDWQRDVDPKEIETAMAECREQSGQVYLISNQNCLFEGTQLIYHTTNDLMDSPYARKEVYLIYEVKK